jgi:hypothetical protein
MKPLDSDTATAIERLKKNSDFQLFMKWIRDSEMEHAFAARTLQGDEAQREAGRSLACGDVGKEVRSIEETTKRFFQNKAMQSGMNLI